MIIKEMYLDDLDKQEYIHFLQTLIKYFYVQFNEELDIVQGGDIND